MNFYTFLSRFGLFKSNYAFKFLFVAFCGIHIPLIGLIVFIVYFQNTISPSAIFITTLGLTLSATVMTLFILKKLIKPIEVASKALIAYRANRTIPRMPVKFTDEAGLLMNNIQATIKSNEELLEQRKNIAFFLSNDLKDFTQHPSSLAHLIISQQSDPQIREYAGLIIQSSERQRNIIDSFMKMLKNEDELSRKTFRVRTINFNEIIAGVKRELAEKLQNKNISIKVESDIDQACLKIDKEYLSMVLLNLLDNAIKFSHVGSEIVVTTKKDKGDLQIAVSDTGIGFDKSIGDAMFKKIISYGMPGTENEQPGGVGLYCCSKIIDKADGLIYGRSRGEEKGAIFYIDLKVYKRL